MNESDDEHESGRGKNRRFKTVLFLVGAPIIVLLLAVAGWKFWESRQSPTTVAVEFQWPCSSGASSDKLIEAKNRVSASSKIQFLQKPKRLPDFTIKSGTDKFINFDSWLGKFKLVNIWATWCPPCRREMPSLDNLQAQLGGPDFEVIPIAAESTSFSKIQSYYEQYRLTSIQPYLDDTFASTKSMNQLGIGRALPTTMLIDRGNCVVGYLKGEADWASVDMVHLLESWIDDLRAPPTSK